MWRRLLAVLAIAMLLASRGTVSRSHLTKARPPICHEAASVASALHTKDTSRLVSALSDISRHAPASIRLVAGDLAHDAHSWAQFGSPALLATSFDRWVLATCRVDLNHAALLDMTQLPQLRTTRLPALLVKALRGLTAPSGLSVMVPVHLPAPAPTAETTATTSSSYTISLYRRPGTASSGTTRPSTCTGLSSTYATIIGTIYNTPAAATAAARSIPAQTAGLVPCADSTAANYSCTTAAGWREIVRTHHGWHLAVAGDRGDVITSLASQLSGMLASLPLAHVASTGWCGVDVAPDGQHTVCGFALGSTLYRVPTYREAASRSRSPQLSTPRPGPSTERNYCACAQPGLASLHQARASSRSSHRPAPPADHPARHPAPPPGPPSTPLQASPQPPKPNTTEPCPQGHTPRHPTPSTMVPHFKTTTAPA